MFVSPSGKLLAEPKRTDSRVRRVLDDIVAPLRHLFTDAEEARFHVNLWVVWAISAPSMISWITASVMLLVHGRLGAALCLVPASLALLQTFEVRPRLRLMQRPYSSFVIRSPTIVYHARPRHTRLPLLPE